MEKLRLRLAHLRPHHIALFEVLFVIAVAFIASGQSAYAANVVRLTDRSLRIYSAVPSAITKYKFSFTYPTQEQIGSIEILFCVSPIPDDPCTRPLNMDASNAILADQTGETGFTVLSRSANRIVLTRSPTLNSTVPSTYTFTNIKNPSNYRAFAARLSTHLSTDGTDPLPYVHLGSVVAGASPSIEIATQVPPILIFCLGETVSLDCTETEGYFRDLGDLSPNETLFAQSQMAVITNASNGYAITVNGTSMTAGNSVIRNISTPSPSLPGRPQFGINLRANTTPEIGGEPDGSWVDAVPAPNYNIPDRFTFNDGDVVAGAPEVNLERRYTVSYIVNSPENLRPGIYSTTVTYICTGNF